MKIKIIRKLKKCISNVVLFFLYRAFYVLYKMDSNIKQEIEGWKEGFCIQIKTEENGPKLTMKKKNNNIEKMKKEINPDLLIEFKSLESAFLMLIGRIGVADAYAQHRFMLKGDISEAMSFVRSIDIVESYLFPRFITKKIVKGKYKRQKSMITVYFHILINR